jgi:serine acetyltransferase
MLARELTDDGAHLNARGRERVAAELLKVLAKAMGAETAADGAEQHHAIQLTTPVYCSPAASARRGWLGGRAWAYGGGRLVIGRGARVAPGAVGVELKVEPNAKLVIGDETVIGPGTSFEAYERIEVGRGCLIGAYCKLLDNHLHNVYGDRAHRPPSVPLVVEEGAVIEDYAVLLPGARVGRGARIGRGAVVSRPIPAFAEVGSQQVHPARVR